MLSRFPTTATVGIQYVGGTTAQITGSTATTTNVSLTGLTGGLASAAAAGDLVVVYYGVGSTVARTLTITTGYTSVASLTISDTYDANLVVAYKFMGATPDTTVTVSATGATADSGAVALQVWRYVDSVFPIDATSTTATSTNTVLVNPPAITPATAGALIIAGGAGAHARGVATYSSSDLSNFITRGGIDNTNDVTVGMGSRAGVDGTAFDPAAFTFSAADSAQYSYCAVTMCLKPSANQVGPFPISVSSNSGDSNTITVAKPTGTREGDLLLASMYLSGKNTTWTGDTGWTEVADQGANPNLRVAYKVAGSSEAASYTFTAATSSNLTANIVLYRNAAYNSVGSITSGANPLVVTSVSSSVDYSCIYATVGRDQSSLLITGPASMQTLYVDSDATAPSVLVEQDISLSLAGGSGTRSFTMGGASNTAGVLVSIKPAASYTKYAQYIANNTAGASSSSSFSVTVNTPACVPGNLLLFVVSTANNSATNVTVSTPSGWTLLVGDSTTTTSVQPGMYVFYRVADGSEAASYSATTSGLGSAAAAIITLAGVNAATLSAGTTNTGSATTSITANGVTATADGIVLYLGAQANNNQGVVTFTPPSGMTEAAESSHDGAAVDITLEVAYQEGLLGGPTGDKTATSSSSAGTNRYRAILVTVGAL